MKDLTPGASARWIAGSSCPIHARERARRFILSPAPSCFPLASMLCPAHFKPSGPRPLTFVRGWGLFMAEKIHAVKVTL